MLTNIDTLFESWKLIEDEIRRMALGKYNGVGKKFNLNNQIPNYDGKTCEQKFNFLLEGNRCLSCNSLSLLTKDGNLNDKIIIESGKQKGKEIIITNFEKYLDIDLCTYEPLMVNFKNLRENLPPLVIFNDILNENIVYMKNIDYVGHLILISVFMKFLKLGENTLISAYQCNSIKLINYNYDFFELKDKNLSSDNCLSIFIRIFELCANYSFFHGSPDISFIKFYFPNVNSIRKYGDKEYNLSVKISILPGPYSSISIPGYENKTICFVSNNTKPVTQFVPLSVKIEKNNQMCQVDLENPTLPNYNQNSIIYIKATQQLFEFCENTGISIFDNLSIYCWLIILLCEKNFYDNFVQPHKDLLEKIFFVDELENILNESKKWHNKKSPKYEECKNMMINLNISMKFDVLYLINSYLMK